MFLITDARFENELQPFPWNMGYPIFNVYIKRDTDSTLSTDEQLHESEAMANDPDLSKFHFIIDNNGDLDHLDESCRNMIDFVLNIRDTIKNSSQEALDDLLKEE